MKTSLAFQSIWHDFWDLNFNSIDTTKYKIYNSQWLELDASTTTIVGDCLSYSIIGGKTIFGKSKSVNYFSIIHLKNEFPAYQIIIAMKILYFETSGQIVYVLINYTAPAPGSIKVSIKQWLNFFASTNSSLECSTPLTIYSAVLPYSFPNGLPKNSDINITLIPNSVGDFGFRDLEISLSYCNPVCLTCLY